MFASTRGTEKSSREISFNSATIPNQTAIYIIVLNERTIILRIRMRLRTYKIIT